MMLSYLFFSALNRQPHTHVNSSKTKLIKCLDECPGPPPDAGCVIFFFFSSEEPVLGKIKLLLFCALVALCSC